MKLSLSKKFGMLQVAARKLLRVAHDHQVLTSTQSELEAEEFKRRYDGAKWVTAKVGDLAVELVAVATGKTIGYGYLTGDAVRLNLYRSDAPPHWFSPAKVLRADTVPLSESIGTMEPVDFLSGVMAMKYAAGADLVTFSIWVENADDMRAMMEAFTGAYPYVPKEMTDEQVKTDTTSCHVIVIARVGKPRPTGKYKGPMGVLHMQPPRDATPYSCSGFHAAMIGDGNWEIFDPWGNVASAKAV